jgi:hypothetical protein
MMIVATFVLLALAFCLAMLLARATLSLIFLLLGVAHRISHLST